jgi:hypothetical protein
MNDSNPDAISVLIKKGANVNVRDKDELAARRK